MIRDNPLKETDHDPELKHISSRLNLLDDRLDNMDSVVTSLVERVMGRPLIVEISCPKCGEVLQINVTSSVRLRGKE